MAMTPSSSSLPVVEDRGKDASLLIDRDRAEVRSGNGAPALCAERLDIAGMLAGAHHPGAGAVVLFSGEVRDNNRGKAVAYLEYEAHGPLITASAHRGESYSANQYIIDRIKQEVPIWKREHYVDGGCEWGSNP
jgi:molybdopterin synthase catalytic subunit